LFEARLKDANIVVNDSLLLSRVVLTHNAHQCEIPIYTQR
jgi:hypothetical protein